MKNIYLSLENNDQNKKLEKCLKDKGFNIIEPYQTKEKFTIIVNNALTDLSNLLLKDYKLEERIEEILLVGGSDGYGDITPSAERNIYLDVNSAQHVFMSQIKIVMFGLNVTNKVDNKALMPLVYLTNPEVFKKDECGIFVETKSELTKGKTVTDVYSDYQFKDHHCEIILDVDLDKYQKLVKEY